MGRFDQLGPADFRVSPRTQLGNNQFTVVVGQKEAVSVPDREHVGPTGRATALRRSERRPQRFAVGQAGAGIFSVWPAGVNQTLLNEGCIMNTGNPAAGGAFPEQLGRFAVFSHLNTGGDAVEPHHIDPVSLHHRLANRHGVGRLDLHGPVNRTVIGIERLQRVTVPYQQLLRPAYAPDDRRAITGLFRAQRSPQFPARHLVKGNTSGSFPPNDADQVLPVHKRMSRGAPLRNLQPVILLEITTPMHHAGLRVKTKQVSLRAKRVHASAVHGRGRPGANRIGGHGRVRAVPLVCPKQFPVDFIQANQALPAGQEFADEVDVAWWRTVMEQFGSGRIALPSQAIHDKHLPVGHGRAGIPRAQFGLPAQRGASLRETIDDPLLAPIRIAVCAEPLRPILRLAKR